MNNFFIRLFVVLCLIINIPVISYSTVIQGGINTNEQLKHFNTVIDKSTHKPISNARITIPSNNYVTYSDINGHFEIKAQINGSAIVSVEKENYKPFSLTINKKMCLQPFVVKIESLTPFDIAVETMLCHLGDNNYSTASANAGFFKSRAVGPVYSKEIQIGPNINGKQYYLVIGSIVGIDTALARGIGQNRITTSFASPPSVYLNGHKIAEIQINGDNQKIRLPHNFIKFNQKNIITIKAGRNLMQRAYIDYDDIEFMNISIQLVSDQKYKRIGSNY